MSLGEKLKKVGSRNICSCVVIVRNRELLLGLRHYTKETWKDISVWTTPGGRCEEGELLEAGLRREVKEETGIEDLVIHEFVGEISGVQENDRVFVFYGTTDSEPKLMEPEKFSEWRWFPLDAYMRGEPGNFVNPRGYELIKSFLGGKLQ